MPPHLARYTRAVRFTLCRGLSRQSSQSTPSGSNLPAPDRYVQRATSVARPVANAEVVNITRVGSRPEVFAQLGQEGGGVDGLFDVVRGA